MDTPQLCIHALSQLPVVFIYYLCATHLVLQGESTLTVHIDQRSKIVLLLTAESMHLSRIYGIQSLAQTSSSTHSRTKLFGSFLLYARP